MGWRAICACSLLAWGTIEAAETASWRAAYDIEGNQALPRFRMANQEMVRSTGKTVNLGGLDKMKLSGSGQFTPRGLQYLLQQTEAAPKDLVILDLRVEPHAFLNDRAISWRPIELRTPVMPMPSAMLFQIEGRKLQEALDQQAVSVWRLGDNQWLGRDRVVPKTGSTEEKLALTQGLRYQRIALADRALPTPEQVDSIVEVIRGLDGTDWLHVHDRDGRAVSTVVMIMADMMYNARSVPFSDILIRQQTLGGSDFVQIPTDPEWDPQPWDRYYPPSAIVPPYRNDAEMWGNNLLGNNPLYTNDPINPFFIPYDPMVFEFEIPDEEWGDPKLTRQRLDLLQNFYQYCREQVKEGYRTPFSKWLRQGYSIDLGKLSGSRPEQRMLRMTWKALMTPPACPAHLSHF
jgi:hypothetical protein